MVEGLNVITKLVDRYDYVGAYELLCEQGLKTSDPAVLINSCRYAVNFDFKTARKILMDLTEETKGTKEIKELNENLKALMDGNPHAIFSELIENIKFQVVNEEFIDFLGRVYRCKEAIYKYIFVSSTLNKKTFSFHLTAMSKRSIIKSLRKQYKVFNSNIIFGISTYVNRTYERDHKYSEIVRLLNSEKMTSLIELRNESIVGHGFSGVSIDDIQSVYGNPYNVLDDFSYCLKKLEIKLLRYKYSMINDFIVKLLDEVNGDTPEEKTE